MSAQEGEGAVLFGEEEEKEEDDFAGGFGGGSMSGSAALAPTQFNVSETTSGSRNSILGDEKEHGGSVTASISFCPCRLCGRRRRPLTCSHCINSGLFVHSEAGHASSTAGIRIQSSSPSPSKGRNVADEDENDDEDDFALPYHAKAEKLAALLASKSALIEKSLRHVEKASRLQYWQTRAHLQEEKLQLLRRSVDESKASNRTLKDSVDEMKDRASQMQLRRRKHNEKVAKVRKFIAHSSSRRDEKRNELDLLKDDLKTWRRKRVEDLVTHIFIIDEGLGQPPLPAYHGGPAACTTDHSTTTRGGDRASTMLSPPTTMRTTMTTPHTTPPARAFFAESAAPTARAAAAVYAADAKPQFSRQSSNERFSHTGDPPNLRPGSSSAASSPRNGDVIPLLLEVNRGWGGGGGGRFGFDEDDFPPKHHPVCDDYLDVDLSATENEDEDDDDSIISQLENSLLPVDELEGECAEAPNTFAYGNLIPMNESYYRIIRPTLPASGDFSKIVPLIVQSQTTSTPTMTVPDPTTGKMVAVEGHSSPRRSRIEKDLMQNAYAALALTAQLVTCLSFYLDVILPKKIVPADFMIKVPKVSSFIKSVNKLNTNVLFLCFSQYVPLNVLQPSQMMHNIQMLLNTTVTPHLGSINHFRVDETLLDSLEESVVIVGNAYAGDDGHLDFSSSSSSSDDDEGKDETPGDWDYIPADMNIPSLPLNEGFANAVETSTLAGGLSSYSITGAAASVASWWRSNR